LESSGKRTRKKRALSFCAVIRAQLKVFTNRLQTVKPNIAKEPVDVRSTFFDFFGKPICVKVLSVFAATYFCAAKKACAYKM